MIVSQPKLASGGCTVLTWTSDKNPLRDDQIKLFKKLNSALELYLDPDNQSMDKVIVQSMGGVGPDLFDSRDATQLSAYVRSGIAWDVTEELSKRHIEIGA